MWYRSVEVEVPENSELFGPGRATVAAPAEAAPSSAAEATAGAGANARAAPLCGETADQRPWLVVCVGDTDPSPCLRSYPPCFSPPPTCSPAAQPRGSRAPRRSSQKQETPPPMGRPPREGRAHLRLCQPPQPLPSRGRATTRSAQRCATTSLLSLPKTSEVTVCALSGQSACHAAEETGRTVNMFSPGCTAFPVESLALAAAPPLQCAICLESLPGPLPVRPSPPAPPRLPRAPKSPLFSASQLCRGPHTS